MPDTPINRDTLQYLSKLARIHIDPGEEEKLLKDLQDILAYVGELGKADTTDVPPMNGGTLLTNAFRDDAAPVDTNRAEGTEAFPETENGYLKVPKVL